MRNHFKFKIFHKTLKKSFFVTSIDYKNNIVEYENEGRSLETTFDNIIMLMPTGVYDSKNNEIYEGDIVTYQSNSLSPKKVSEVIFQNGCFMTKLLLSKQLEAKMKKDNVDEDIFTDLLFLATTANYKPIKIIGNVFTYNSDKSSKKIKTTKLTV